jgi:hypothetical protein
MPTAVIDRVDREHEVEQQDLEDRRGDAGGLDVGDLVLALSGPSTRSWISLVAL